jgi:hypothetical protein
MCTRCRCTHAHLIRTFLGNGHVKKTRYINSIGGVKCTIHIEIEPLNIEWCLTSWTRRLMCPIVYNFQFVPRKKNWAALPLVNTYLRKQDTLIL